MNSRQEYRLLGRSRRGPFTSASRLSGRAARRLRESFAGETGIIVDIRQPALMMNGVALDSVWWPVRWICVGVVKVPVGMYTVRPVAVRCPVGWHSVQFCDGGLRLVKSVVVEVRERELIILTIRPPTISLFRGHQSGSFSLD